MITYRITRLNPNFKVGKYPDTAPGEPFKVTFSFRLNNSSRWISRTLTFNAYDVCVIFKDKDNRSNLDVMHFNTGQSIDLRYYYEMVYETGDGDISFISNIDSIFPGWSRTIGGSRTDFVQTFTEPGIYRFYQMPRQDVPENFKVKVRFYNSMGSYFCAAAVYAYNGSDEDVVIPQYIHEIQSLLPQDGRESVEFNSLFISRDVEEIDLTGITVRNAFVVEKGNTAFSSENGILYNYEKTRIIARPACSLGETGEASNEKADKENERAEENSEIKETDLAEEVNGN